MIIEKMQKIPSIYIQPVKYFSSSFTYFSLRRIEMEESLPTCFEDNFIYIYITEGQGNVCINGQMFRIKEGYLLSIHSYHVFALHPEHGSHLKVTVCTIDYQIINFLNIYSWQKDETYELQPVIKLEQEECILIEELLNRLEQESSKSKDKAGKLIMWGLLGQIMTASINMQYNRYRRDAKLPLGWSVLLFITKYSSQHLTTATVAKSFGVNAETINRELRRITSYNFQHLLNRARINVVCSCLYFQDISLRFFAGYVGFSSENSFYRAFQEWRSMTPQEYRNKMLNIDNGYCLKAISDLPLMIMNYIMLNYKTNINPKTAASSLYIAESSVNSMLIKYMGLTFQELLTTMRLRYATSLLSISKIPICDIAEECGFNSLHTFGRLFKNAYGVTASEYRKKKNNRAESSRHFQLGVK